VTTIATPDADSAATQELLERYARIAIRVGINLEPGRELAIRAMIEHAPLVRALVKAGYEAGARRVEVDYEDLEVPAKDKHQHAGNDRHVNPPKRRTRTRSSREAHRGGTAVIARESNERTKKL
jgi:aminopeptidase